MAKYCYECFDDLLFERLGQCVEYMKAREDYGIDQHDDPFICEHCKKQVDPRKY